MGRGLKSAVSGVLCLDKPSGVTSRDVVNQVVRVVGRGVKVGHAGTLDPLATGVLVVCLGGATRLIDYVQRQVKCYRTVVRLGAESDTLDADGTIIEREAPVPPGDAELAQAVAGQVGVIDQLPPEYSALRVGGRRAYDLARSGASVELAPRPVTIHRIDVLSYEWPRLTLEVECGAGTYIRSIARDLGLALGCGGLVEVLTRTRIGDFTQQNASDPSRLTRETLPDILLPPVHALAGLSRIHLDESQVGEVRQGRSVAIRDSIDSVAGQVALVGPAGELVGVGEAHPEDRRVYPRRVLVGGA